VFINKANVYQTIQPVRHTPLEQGHRQPPKVTGDRSIIKTILRLMLVCLLVFILANEPPKQIKAEVQSVTVTKKAVVATSVTPTVAPVPTPEPVQPMSNREIGQQMASEKGWTGDQWLCLEKLWTNESNWQHTAANYQGSGAYGIAQALPAEKMASYGEDYLTNPRTQIAWGLDYIANRYQTPCGALSFWNSQLPNHWY
jgi:hypothetical protein